MHSENLLTPEEISPNELKTLLAEVILIDVREELEFQERRIPQANLFPLSEFDSETTRAKIKAKIREKNTQKIVFYCKSGKRSLRAAEFFLETYEQKALSVFNLTGGIEAWQESQLEIIS